MFAHQVEHDPAVDIARRPVGRHLEIVQVNLSHEGKRTLAFFDGASLTFNTRGFSKQLKG